VGPQAGAVNTGRSRSSICAGLYRDFCISRLSQQPMKDWSTVGVIHFKPAPGSDLTKVLFAEFTWVVGDRKE
jgi:hypothetical protein